MAIHSPVKPAVNRLLRWRAPVVGSAIASSSPIPEGAFLLLETGDYLLLENSMMVLSENGNTAQPIIDGPDDGDYDDGGGFDNTANDIDLGNDAGTAKKGFFYFASTGIPQGSSIVTAYLRVTASDNLSDATVNLKFVGADEDAAAVPQNKVDAASRPRTTAETYWNDVGAWVIDVQYDSPSIKAIIQEIVDRDDFGGPILIFVEDNGSTVNGKRKVNSYNGDPTKVAVLVVQYLAEGVAAPSSLTATTISTEQINLAWIDNSSVTPSFMIERATDGGGYTQIDTVAAGTTTYQDTGLSHGARYYYRVRAYSGNVVSEYSNVATDQTFVGADDIANLEFWIEGLEGTYEDSAKTTPATDDLDPVGAWEDQSGNGEDVLQTVAGSRGTLQAAEINSLNVVEFDGAADYLKNATGFLGGASGAIFAVLKLGTGQAGAIIASADEASATRYVIAHAWLSATYPYLHIGQRNNDVADSNAGSTEIVVDNAYILVLISDGAEYRLRVNGSEEYVLTIAGGNNGDWFGDVAGLDNVTVAAYEDSGGVSDYFDGLMGEVIVYSSVPAQDDIYLLERSLADKWDITLSSVAERFPSIVLTNTPGAAVGEPNVIYDGDPQLLDETNVFKMWYARNTVGGTDIYYAESASGKSFTIYGSVLSSHELPSVFKDSGTYYLYTVNTATGNLDLYTAVDGVTFGLDTAAVLTVGAGGQWDDANLGNNCVWIEGGTWYMLYEARQAASPWKIGLATSADGTTWNKSGSNPVITETVTNGGPEVHKAGSTYYLYQHRAEDGGTSLPTGIYRRTSTDLLNWSGPTKILGRETVNEGAGTAVGQAADPGVIERDGDLYMYYGAYPDGSGALVTESYIKLVTFAGATVDSDLAPRSEP